MTAHVSNDLFCAVFPRYAGLLDSSQDRSNDSLETFLREELPRKVELVRNMEASFNTFLTHFSSAILKRPQQAHLVHSLALKATDKVEKYFQGLSLAAHKMDASEVRSRMPGLDLQKLRREFRERLQGVQELVQEKYVRGGLERACEEEVCLRLYTLLELYHFLKGDPVTVAAKFRLREQDVLWAINKNEPPSDIALLLSLDPALAQSLEEVVAKRCRPFVNKRELLAVKVRDVLREGESKVGTNFALLLDAVLGKERSRISRELASALTRELREIEECSGEAEARELAADVEGLKREFTQLKNMPYFLDLMRGNFAEKYKMEVRRLENVFYLSNLEKYLQDVSTFLERVLALEERVVANRREFMREFGAKIEDKISALVSFYDARAPPAPGLPEVIQQQFELLESALYGVVSQPHQGPTHDNSAADDRRRRDEARRLELEARAHEEKERRERERTRAEDRKREEEERLRRAREEREEKEQQRRLERQRQEEDRRAELERKREEKMRKDNELRRAREDEMRRKDEERREKEKADRAKREQTARHKAEEDDRKRREREEESRRKEDERRRILEREEADKRRKQQELKERRQAEEEDRARRLQERKAEQERLRKQKEERDAEQRRKDEERARLDKERREKEQRQADERRKEQELRRKERDEKEREQRALEAKKKEEQRARLEQQRKDREKKQAEERERKQRQRKERQAEQRRREEERRQTEKEKRDKEEAERKQKAEADRVAREKQEQRRKDEAEKARLEKERKDKEERERKEREEKERKEQIQKQRRQRQQRERLERERKEKEEREKKDRLEKERKQKEERQRKQREQRERREQEQSRKKQEKERLEREAEARRLKEEQERREQEREKEEKERQRKEEEAAKAAAAAQAKPSKKEAKKSSGFSYWDDLDDMLDDDMAALDREGKLDEEDDYADDFEADSPPKEGAGEIEGKELIGEDDIKCLQDYMKGTSYGRKNKPNAELVNRADLYSMVFDEFIQNRKLFVFEGAISKGIEDLGAELNNPSTSEDDLRMSVDTIKEEMLRAYDELLPEQELSPLTRYVFPFPYPNPFRLRLLEMVPAHCYFRTVLEAPVPEDEEAQGAYQGMVEALLHIFELEAEPQLEQLVLSEESAAVLGTFEGELPCLLALFALHYEPASKQPLRINQYTIERLFYTANVIDPLYKAMKDNDEIEECFAKLAETYEAGEKVRICSVQVASGDADYSQKLTESALALKQQFLAGKVPVVLVCFAVELQDESEEVVDKVAVYMALERASPKPTVSYFIVSKDAEEQENASLVFELVSEGDEAFAAAVYTESSRHYCLSNYSDWSLPLWAHVTQKRKLSVLGAMRAMAFAMTPYYLAFKQQD